MTIQQRIQREQLRRDVANRLAREAYVDKLYRQGWQGNGSVGRPDEEEGAIFNLVVFGAAAGAWALLMLGINWLVG